MNAAIMPFLAVDIVIISLSSACEDHQHQMEIPTTAHWEATAWKDI